LKISALFFHSIFWRYFSQLYFLTIPTLFMKPVILIDENIPLLAEALQPAIHDAWQIIHYSGRYLPVDRMPHCDALFVRSVTRVDESVLDATSVVFVGTATSGYEHVDTEYLRRRNIYFADAPGCNANSVAEYALYSMLKWAELRSLSLAGLTLGIVGYGHIGRLITLYARAMGMRVVVNDPPLKERRYAFGDNVEYVEFPDLLRCADVVTNHVPFKREGKHAGFVRRARICCNEAQSHVHSHVAAICGVGSRTDTVSARGSSSVCGGGRVGARATPEQRPR
jgi:phosphoglycerate dehydrogenase-like enzyme